jgi:hypothetical protein
VDEGGIDRRGRIVPLANEGRLPVADRLTKPAGPGGGWTGADPGGEFGGRVADDAALGILRNDRISSATDGPGMIPAANSVDWYNKNKAGNFSCRKNSRPTSGGEPPSASSYRYYD